LLLLNDDELVVTVLEVVVILLEDFLEVVLNIIGPAFGGVLNYSNGLLVLSNGPELKLVEGPNLNYSNGLLSLSNGPFSLALT